MKKCKKKVLHAGVLMMALFAIWTFLIQTVDVQPAGQNGTDIGFSALNLWFHKLTGVHMKLYIATDWLGLVPILCCLIFGMLGAIQLIRRKSLCKVDRDLLLLGIYYILVIFGYLIFEMIPINYRPILIEGNMEASYPSSTTLLVFSVMPTVSFQAHYRIKHTGIRTIIKAFVVLFSLFMGIGRTIAGVHWLTDIVGSVLFSAGLYLIYQSAVLFWDQKQEDQWRQYYGIE